MSTSKGTIIYIGNFELPDKNAAANRVMANAKVFRSLGYSVVFIGLEKGSQSNHVGCILNKEYSGFKSWNRPYPDTSIERIRILFCIDDIVNIIRKCDEVTTVICYNYPSIAFYRIMRFCKKKGIRVIADCTEWYPNSYEIGLFSIVKNADTALRMYIMNKKADALIVASSYLRNFYNGKNVAIIPSLSIVEHVSYPICSSRNSVKIIYAGTPFRIGKRLHNKETMKDRLDIAISMLYQAFRRGINFNFDIYGITKEQYIQALPTSESALTELGGTVKFHGYVGNGNVRDAIKASDFSILIRDNNRTTMAGFPTKFTESISLCTPMITTNTSDLSKYLVEGKNGFFVDISKEGRDIDKLIAILSLSPEEIFDMKKYCYETRIFDLSRWIEPIKPALEGWQATK